MRTGNPHRRKRGPPINTVGVRWTYGTLIQAARQTGLAGFQGFWRGGSALGLETAGATPLQRTLRQVNPCHALRRQKRQQKL
jgi:hypothetical protein